MGEKFLVPFSSQQSQHSPARVCDPQSLSPQHYLCRLRVERDRLYSREQSEEHRRLFTEGFDVLLETIKGDTPWNAAWPENKLKTLSALMVEAVDAECPVTAAFLHRRGAWSFFRGDMRTSALATALEKNNKGMAELLVRTLGSSIYADVPLLRDIKLEDWPWLEQVSRSPSSPDCYFFF